eukprot:scaffold51478_cov96-Cyclotella_meneghiniana.AAC.2
MTSPRPQEMRNLEKLKSIILFQNGRDYNLFWLLKDLRELLLFAGKITITRSILSCFLDQCQPPNSLRAPRSIHNVAIHFQININTGTLGLPGGSTIAILILVLGARRVVSNQDIRNNAIAIASTRQKKKQTMASCREITLARSTAESNNLQTSCRHSPSVLARGGQRGGEQQFTIVLPRSLTAEDMIYKLCRLERRQRGAGGELQRSGESTSRLDSYEPQRGEEQIRV